MSKNVKPPHHNTSQKTWRGKCHTLMSDLRFNWKYFFNMIIPPFLLLYSVFQDLGATTKFPPPLSQRARGDKILPLPLGEGWGEGAKS
jgi:hypothetical protein